MQAHEARPLRGHHRPGRPLPPRPDEREPAHRVRRPQERPGPGQLHPPRRHRDPRGVLRPADLPGAGAEDRPEDRRLLPGRGGPDPQGHRQEAAGQDGRPEGAVHRRDRPAGLRQEARRGPLGPDRGFRQLCVQQVPLRRLRPGHLPDRLAEGPLPGGVHGGAADQRQEQQGQAACRPAQLPHDGDRGPGPRHQRLAGQLRAGD